MVVAKATSVEALVMLLVEVMDAVVLNVVVATPTTSVGLTVTSEKLSKNRYVNQNEFFHKATHRQ